MNENKKKILLAEDDKFLSRALEESFKKSEFEAIKILDGKEVFGKVKSEKPDLVLLDLMMVGKNGFDILEEIKADEETKNIPIIVFSNLGQNSDIDKAKELGADGYLIKVNYSLKEITKKIEEYL